MKKKLVARTAKLLSENRKFKTDSGISIAYEHQPKDPIERNHGIIFAVIEIIAPVHSAEEIAELIIDTFHNEYYRNLDLEPLQSFESALSRINEELAEITEQGKIHWLGRLNAILAVLSDNTLHLTQAGNAETILYRKGKLSVVSQDLAGDAINPLRTFINIASGNLSEGDRVGIFSPGIFYYLSNEELERYITEFHPNVAINHLANIVEEGNGSRRSSAIIIEMLAPETLAGDTLPEDREDEVWITDTQSGIEAVTQSASPIAMKIAKKSMGILGFIVVFIAEGLIPFFINIFGNVKNLIFGVASKPKENIFVEAKEALSSSRKETIEFEEKSFEEAGSEILDVPTDLPEKEKSSLVYSTFKNFAASAKKTKNLLPKNSKTLVITILAVFLVATSFLSINKKRIEKQKSSSEKILAEAIAKYDEAENFIILNENEKAINNLNEAKTLAEKAKKTKYFSKEADELLGKIAGKMDSALGIVKVSGGAFSDLSNIGAKEVLGLASTDSKLYTINSDGVIYEIDTGSGENSVLLSDADIRGKTVAITSIENTSVLAILTDEPRVYSFDTKTKDFSKADISGGEWEKGVDIGSFLTNLYIASKEDKNIWKHIKTTGGYGKKIGYIKDPDAVDLSDIVSIAIDGSIYVLKQNGSVLKFISGVQKEFNVSGLPEPLKDPKKIFANADVKGLFIVNGNKVIRINEKNEFVNQYSSDGFSNITGLYADGSNLYVLSGTKIYKIGL